MTTCAFATCCRLLVYQVVTIDAAHRAIESIAADYFSIIAPAPPLLMAADYIR
jgi:hypothetical protein